MCQYFIFLGLILSINRHHYPRVVNQHHYPRVINQHHYPRVLVQQTPNTESLHTPSPQTRSRITYLLSIDSFGKRTLISCLSAPQAVRVFSKESVKQGFVRNSENGPRIHSSTCICIWDKHSKQKFVDCVAVFADDVVLK